MSGGHVVDGKGTLHYTVPGLGFVGALRWDHVAKMAPWSVDAEVAMAFPTRLFWTLIPPALRSEGSHGG